MPIDSGGNAGADSEHDYSSRSRRSTPSVPLPSNIARVLNRAQQQELAATGSGRREQFRATRVLIGAAIDAGYSRADIARVFGVTVASTRTRQHYVPGYLSAELIIGLAQLLSFSTVRTWKFEVGVDERHAVQIDKHRAVMFARFRPQPVYAYVDGVLVARNNA